MTILHDSEDYFHNLVSPGSYEWSYFDGLSEDAEWGFVAIWFRGCPMSPYYTAAIDHYFRNPSSAPPDPGEYVAFNFNLYHRGRRIYYALHEQPRSLWHDELHRSDIKLAGNTVRFGYPRQGGKTTLLGIDTRLSYQMSHIVGDIDIDWRQQDLDSLTSDYVRTETGHFWVPAALDGKFTAQLDLWRLGRRTRPLHFNGRAYHDRNFGTAPLHHLEAAWHWGRVHSDEHTFVYFAVLPEREGRSERFQRMILLSNGMLAGKADSFDLYDSPRSPHWSTLPYPRVVKGENGGAVPLDFIAQQAYTVDSGPFYHRLISEFTVRMSGLPMIDSAPGITEFLRPARLGVAPFRPFVKFRVRRGR